ncbi:MAG: DsbA family protein [Rhodospirillales bacterium]|nr:DsbA family protein [Rhodospirillales bacterium]
MNKVLQFFAVTFFGAVVMSAPIAQAADTPLNNQQVDAVKALIRDTLVKNPEIVMEAIRTFQRQQAEAEQLAKKHALAQSKDLLLNDPSSPVLGNPNGDVSLVEFFDYRCGYCKRVFPSVMKLLKDDGNIKYIVKEFPILGPESVYASKAALAAHEQGKYLEMHVALMEVPGGMSNSKIISIAKSIGLDTDKLKKDMESDKVKEAIGKTHMLAQSLGISGTPAFVIGEEFIPGAIGIDKMKELIQTAREKKKNG